MEWITFYTYSRSTGGAFFNLIVDKGDEHEELSMYDLPVYL